MIQNQNPRQVKMKSRKFWIAIFSVIGLIGAALSGEITLADAVGKSVFIILGYFGANGIEHLAEGVKKQ
jgi:uncharacterized membrane protein